MAGLIDTLVYASLRFPLSDRPWRVLGYSRRPRRGRFFARFSRKAEFEDALFQWIWHCTVYELVEVGFDDRGLETRARIGCRVMEEALGEKGVPKSFGYQSRQLAEEMSLLHLKELLLTRDDREIFEVCRESFVRDCVELYPTHVSADWEERVWELFYRGPIAATCRRLRGGQEKLPRLEPVDLVIENQSWLDDLLRRA